MINPCRSCGLGMSDKNNERCIRCERRIEYVAALEGRSCSVPVEMMEYELRLLSDDKAELNAYWRGPEAFLCLYDVAQELQSKGNHNHDKISWQDTYELFMSICRSYEVNPFE